MRERVLRQWLAPAVAAAIGMAPGRAQGEERQQQLDWTLNLGISAAFIATYVTAEWLKADLAPEHCRWCDTEQGRWDPPGVDRTFRDWLLADDPAAAGTTSNILGYYALPLGGAGILALAADGDWEAAAEDITILSQAVSASAVLNLAVKMSAGRARPFTHDSPVPFSEDPDQNLSFYSGHTNLAFSSVVGTGLLLYKRDSPYAPWVLGLGLPAAATVGALRIAADKHYFTDVMVGALVGSGVSALVVWVLH